LKLPVSPENNFVTAMKQLN